MLNWLLHIDMEAINCVELLNNTISSYAKCEIFNTDQGSQYTSTIFPRLRPPHSEAPKSVATETVNHRHEQGKHIEAEVASRGQKVC